MIDRRFIAWCLVFWAFVPAGGTATAQTRPATTPATTVARVKQVLVIPAGFKTIKVGNHAAMLEPADEAWVREVLTGFAPTTMPSTMPADILGRLNQNRQALKSRIMADLGITDAAVVDSMISDRLEPALKRFVDHPLPLFYMVTSEARLKQLLREGWSNPRFYYNRVADAIQLNSSLMLSFGQEADDLLLPSIYSDGATPEQKRDRLTSSVRESERMLGNEIADRGLFETQALIVNFIYEQSINPLQLKLDQDWFGVGIASMLSADYLELTTGVSADNVQKNMTIDDPRNPIRSVTIDLLRPTPVADMVEQAKPFYADAFRRKAGRAVLSWLDRGGDKSIAKVLAEIKRTPPADGQALVNLIKQVSGVDVAEDLKSGR